MQNLCQRMPCTRCAAPHRCSRVLRASEYIIISNHIISPRCLAAFACGSVEHHTAGNPFGDHTDAPPSLLGVRRVAGTPLVTMRCAHHATRTTMLAPPCPVGAHSPCFVLHVSIHHRPLQTGHYVLVICVFAIVVSTFVSWGMAFSTSIIINSVSHNYYNL